MLFKGRLSIWSYLITSFSVLTVIPLILFVFPKISQFGRESASFLVIFGKLLRACFIVPGPAKLKIVRVRSLLNDVSVPFASCPPNWRHSEYYSCQTELKDVLSFGLWLFLPVIQVLIVFIFQERKREKERLAFKSFFIKKKAPSPKVCGLQKFTFLQMFSVSIDHVYYCIKNESKKVAIGSVTLSKSY